MPQNFGAFRESTGWYLFTVSTSPRQRSRHGRHVDSPPPPLFADEHVHRPRRHDGNHSCVQSRPSTGVLQAVVSGHRERAGMSTVSTGHDNMFALKRRCKWLRRRRRAAENAPYLFLSERGAALLRLAQALGAEVDSRSSASAERPVGHDLAAVALVSATVTAAPQSSRRRRALSQAAGQPFA